MTNGQEKARENLVAFQRWAATKTDDYLKQIVFRGQLNCGEVANAIGIGKSAVRQNPAIKSLVLKYLGRIAACGERAEPSIEIEATSIFLIEADLFCRRDSGSLSTLRSQSEHSDGV